MKMCENKLNGENTTQNINYKVKINIIMVSNVNVSRSQEL